MATLQELKTTIFDYVRYSLGDSIVDVELDPVHYETALSQALIRYRQRSSNSVEESYSFLNLIMDTNTYTLPREVISVRNCFFASVGAHDSAQ